MGTKRLLGGVIAKAFFLAAALGLVACGGGGDSPPPTGTLTVTVTQAGSDPAANISNARVAVIDGASGDVVKVLTTDSKGTASSEFLVGQVLLKVSAQGYYPSPASAAGSPLPFVIQGGKTTAANIALTPMADASGLGWISGKVLAPDETTGVGNALVIASSSATGTPTWYTAATNTDGTFTLFNVPAGTADVSALRAGYNFSSVMASVTATAETSGTNISSTAANGTLSGSVTFLATQNGVVDVTLLHPETGEVIPGLRTYTDASNHTYTLSKIPDGTFSAIASLKTDTYVLDPDRVAKFGVPQVTVSGGVASPNPLDFSVTGAIKLTQPVNLQVLPIGAATFKWNAYPSTKNYTVKVTDENGDVVWGDYAPLVGSNYTVGTATQATCPAALLTVGKTYHVRVYASVDDTKSPDGYTIISSTEDLEGVFTVGP